MTERQVYKSFQEQTVDLLAALNAARGYLLNAKIDLETGAPKKTALNTIEGGLRMIDAAFDKATGRDRSDT